MINKKRFQKFIFFLSFLICCIILFAISLSVYSDNWVIVTPNRQMPPNYFVFRKKVKENSTGNDIVLVDNEKIQIDWSEYLSTEYDNEEKNSWPVDLHEKKGCKRFTGKIRFGFRFECYCIILS